MIGSASSGQALVKGRIGLFDIVRGFSVLSMVLFHLCYDLKFLANVDLPWFEPPLQDIWRASISWTFLFVAGCMCPLSRSNLRRSLEYGAVAALIWAATSLIAVDTPISFGIIFCMSACTFVAYVLQRFDALPSGAVAAALLLLGFLLLQGISDGTVAFGLVKLPKELYATEWLSWLGFPGPHFSSGDYYPLLPYLLMFLCGASLGSLWKSRGYPVWAMKVRLEPFTTLGRHALIVYLLHQPLILAVVGLIS